MSGHWSSTDLPDFDKWWDEHGQFLRSGGTEYTRTFAYEAWKSLKLKLTGEPVVGQEEKKHRYFIAYSHVGHDNSFGNGWVEVKLIKPIRSSADLEYVRDLVIEKNGYKAVAITGWQRFEEENEHGKC
jgi:hypothetical protein